MFFQLSYQLWFLLILFQQENFATYWRTSQANADLPTIRAGQSCREASNKNAIILKQKSVKNSVYSSSSLSYLIVKYINTSPLYLYIILPIFHKKEISIFSCGVTL